MEIAQQLGVNQSTICDDIYYITREAKRKVVEVTDNISFECIKYPATIDEIVRELWKIANIEIDPLNNNNNAVDPNAIISANINNKNRIAALSLLLETYKHRMEIMTGGWKTSHDHVGTTIMAHGYAMKEQMKTPKERESDRNRMILGDLADVASLNEQLVKTNLQRDAYCEKQHYFCENGGSQITEILLPVSMLLILSALLLHNTAFSSIQF
jgi:hypothetical protein